MTVSRFIALAAAVVACLYAALGGSSAGSTPHARALDPALSRAVQQATRAARRDGIAIHITSGLRTPAYQQKLLDDAIVRYGSEKIARRYVNTPERSTHVLGKAVDIGPTDAAYWMIQHGPEFGLCQIYANEIWHFERVVRPGGTCPPMKPDASEG